jgi:23S rRNA pseudouridine1911/1915/1917 synthase
MLDILYEDDALIFINKPPGIIVQRAYDPDEPILIDQVSAHTTPAFLLQRLDRGTSGVIFFSKRADINAKLTRQFEQKRLHKTYIALVEGCLAEPQTIDAPLKRIGAIKFGVREGGKRAITEVRPRLTAEHASVVELALKTGRTHQIRVHLAAIGHPLTGDWLYGERNAARPMLHASSLDLTHPVTNEALRVSAPLPEDFLQECERRGIVTVRGQSDIASVQLNH